jgi:hypothetical protein
MKLVTAVAAVVLAVPLVGCATEVPVGSLPGGAVAGPEGGHASAEPTVIPADRNEGFQYCSGPGRYVAYDTFKVTGSVLAGTPEVEGSVRLRNVTYAPKPKGEQPTAGVLGVLPNGEVAATNWKARKPFEGAHLEAGTYYLFAQFRAGDNDYLTAVNLPFTTTQGAHSATYLQNAVFDTNC